MEVICSNMSNAKKTIDLKTVKTRSTVTVYVLTAYCTDGRILIVCASVSHPQ